MKKTPHSHITWLTISEAANILKSTLGETTGETDILHLALEDNFPIYLRTDHTPARRVKPHYCENTARTIWKHIDDIHTFKQFEEPQKLELKESNSKKSLWHLMSNTLTSSFVDAGVIIESDGDYWMILNPHPHEDYAKRQSTKPAWLTPRTDFPRKDELTINIGDIEHFENSHPTSPHK